MFFGQCTAAFADRGQTRLRAGLIAKSLVLAIVTVNCAHANSNLLPNGDFSNAEKISGWTGDPAGAVSFSPFDFGASASSGSLLVQGDVFTPGIATSSCFAIEPRTNYTFGGVYDIGITLGFGNVGEAAFTCKSFATTNCSGTAVDIGHSVIDTESGNDPFSFAFEPTDRSAQSAQCSASIETTFSSLPGSTPSFLNIDNLYFAPTNPNPISLGGYLSGSWYDPTQSGQGFQLEFTGQANQLIAAWFTFAPDGSGKPIWIYGQGEYDPLQSVVTISAAISSGTNFPPAFHGSDIKKTPWGSLTFTFTNCNHASVAWKSDVPGFGSGKQPLTRLTSINGLSCPQSN